MSKSKINTQEDKLLGAMFPGDMASFLSFYAMYTAQNRSSVIRQAITFWRTQISVTDEELVNWAKEQLRVEWNQQKHKQKDTDSFLMDYRNRLESKGISSEMVDVIINGFQP